MSLVFSRKNTPLKIMRDGEEVGRIIHSDHGGYGLFLSGIYWTQDGRATRRGGASGRHFARLKDAKRRAAIVLGGLP